MTTRTDLSASPPIESRDDLLSVFQGGEKPRDAWRIGTEHEKFVYRLDDHRAPSWDETDNSTARRIRSDDLQAEKVRSVDVNLEHHIGTHRLIVGGFYSHWDNLVELAPLSDAEAIRAIRDVDQRKNLKKTTLAQFKKSLS